MSTEFMRHIASIDEVAAKSFWLRYISGYLGKYAFSPRAGAAPRVPQSDRALKIGIKLPTRREWCGPPLPCLLSIWARGGW